MDESYCETPVDRIILHPSNRSRGPLGRAHSLSRRRLLVGLTSLPLATLGSPLAVAAQGATPTVVSVTPQGQTVMEFVAKINQNGPQFTLLGYLTHVQGMDEAELFNGGSPAERSEDTARLTIYGAAQTTSLAEVEDQLYAVDATGTLTFYVNDKGGADFDTDKGFQTGTAVATVAAHFQNVITVTSKTQGLATGIGDLTVSATTPFTLGGTTYQLGQPGQFWRISFTGPGTLHSPQPPVATIYVAGSAVGK